MKPTIYRITHLWPNKQPGQGLTAQIEEGRGEEGWTIEVCPRCGHPTADGPEPRHLAICTECYWEGRDARRVEVVPAADSSTVQIKPETDEPNALPSRFVSLQDYEALEREARS